MTSLINIQSDMRKRINQRLYTTQLCIKHLGVPNPGPAEIRNFKDSWNHQYRVPIQSITKAQKILKEQEIPPLLYDIRTNNWDWAGDGEEGRSVLFYEEEDYILFKLLHKNS